MNALRQRGLARLGDGKKKLLLGGYHFLSKGLMQLVPSGRGGNWSHTVFSWSFIVLTWNLMSRPDSIEKLMLAHFDWNNDCMTVEEQVIIKCDSYSLFV